MSSLGVSEVLVVLVVALLVLGPTKLPEAARQVGKAIGELRRVTSGIQAEVRDAFEVSVPTTASTGPGRPAAWVTPPLPLEGPDGGTPAGS